MKLIYYSIWFFVFILLFLPSTLIHQERGGESLNSRGPASALDQETSLRPQFDREKNYRNHIQ